MKTKNLINKLLNFLIPLFIYHFEIKGVDLSFCQKIREKLESKNANRISVHGDNYSFSIKSIHFIKTLSFGNAKVYVKKQSDSIFKVKVNFILENILLSIFVTVFASVLFFGAPSQKSEALLNNPFLGLITLIVILNLGKKVSYFIRFMEIQHFLIKLKQN